MRRSGHEEGVEASWLARGDHDWWFAPRSRALPIGDECVSVWQALVWIRVLPL